MDWYFTEDRPIWQQLTEQLTLSICKGEYPPGGRLPAVRELAAQAGVNPNTMQRALTELERDGLVYSQRTAGRFVTEDEELVRQAKRSLAEKHIRTFLAAMLRLGYRREEIVELLEQETSEGGIEDGGFRV